MILIKKHVHLHLGTIHVDSKTNQGTRITIEIPA